MPACLALLYVSVKTANQFLTVAGGIFHGSHPRCMLTHRSLVEAFQESECRRSSAADRSAVPHGMVRTDTRSTHAVASAGIRDGFNGKQLDQRRQLLSHAHKPAVDHIDLIRLPRFEELDELHAQASKHHRSWVCSAAPASACGLRNCADGSSRLLFVQRLSTIPPALQPASRLMNLSAARIRLLLKLPQRPLSAVIKTSSIFFTSSRGVSKAKVPSLFHTGRKPTDHFVETWWHTDGTSPCPAAHRATWRQQPYSWPVICEVFLTASIFLLMSLRVAIPYALSMG